MLDRMAVLGAGSWGTALAYLFSRRCGRVRLWARSDHMSLTIQESRRNDRYLPGITLPAEVTCGCDMAWAVDSADIVILAVPSFAIEATSRMLQPRLPPEAIVLSGAKGLESATGRRLSQVVEDAIPGVRDRLAVLSGPNLAGEAAAGQPTATVVAAFQEGVGRRIQDELSLPQFRIYRNPDVIGVELGGALKNIVAIAAGIIDGLGHGENTKAALVSRGLNEIRRLGRSLGAADATFSGLSGIGDLYATCASSQSRNHRVGVELGRGSRLNEILQGMDQTAEGVPTIQAALLLAATSGVEMPITHCLHSVVFENADPRQSLEALMARATSCENDG
ncbi:MAG: NAD(P)-dependent glycerol-3-phosphate dehydrogenase [Armatimonadota bacterium]|nr:NAD(P)-dependent glycerol-3-phosphate dehydrogenase [Armatimonadota bacterium]